MKHLLMLLVLAGTMMGQTPAATPPSAQPMQPQRTPALDIGTVPTPADMYCAGFISTDKVPESSFVAAGWNSPDQTRYAGISDIVYIHGHGLKEGDRYQIVRHVKDPNHFELYKGQAAAVRAAGETYFELGSVKIMSVQKDTGIAVPELSCADFVPGDLAIPFETRPAPKFRKVTLDRFAPPNGKTQGRIILSNEFDSFVGTKYKVYLNIGADKGLKVGDYLRATRTYSYTYADPESGMSLKASAREDQQYKEPTFTDLASLPRRTLGDMMVLSVHKRSATAMVLSALEDIHVGDGVELMDVTDAPELQPVLPASAGQPNANMNPTAHPNAEPVPPKISCTAAPATVRVGESSSITCEATSPDGRPVSIAFVANGGKLSSNRNQATLETAETVAGPIAVRATAFDDRQLSASAITTVNVEAGTPPVPTAQKLTSLDFKPNSAYVDNRSKAILDDVALKLQQDPNSTAVLTGAAMDPEPTRLANQRANNAMTYLTKSKGIDGQRLQVKTGSSSGRVVDIWSLPQGASLPSDKPADDKPSESKPE
jgi:outer membrane protein OmpA-like peptidoglycan-associated protein